MRVIEVIRQGLWEARCWAVREYSEAPDEGCILSDMPGWALAVLPGATVAVGIIVVGLVVGLGHLLGLV